MRHKFPDLPDAFVERVKVLELKLDSLEKEIASIRSSHANHKKETRRIREVTQLFSWVPGGPKAFLGVMLTIIFFASLTAEIVLKTTNFHLEIRRYLIEVLEFE
jgi:hypothetical protein